MRLKHLFKNKKINESIPNIDYKKINESIPNIDYKQTIHYKRTIDYKKYNSSLYDNYQLNKLFIKKKKIKIQIKSIQRL